MFLFIHNFAANRRQGPFSPKPGQDQEMKQTYTVAGLRAELDKHSDKSIGFVPTMGALHEGHISLVERAREENDMVVVSLFVNPTQFNDPEDLRKYPRTIDSDLHLLEKAGADIVFIPSVEEVYPEPDSRRFDFGNIDKVMEGATRPGHFNGVAQVVSRLFDIVKPGRVYFGEKDFQQIAIIKELVKQLDIDVKIIECPIVREGDGLAMSSRNALLTPEHRAAAPGIYSALREAVMLKDMLSVAEVEDHVRRTVEKNPLLQVIYFNIVDADTLIKISGWDEAKKIQGCIAVQAGAVRLIDNIRFI